MPRTPETLSPLSLNLQSLLKDTQTERSGLRARISTPAGINESRARACRIASVLAPGLSVIVIRHIDGPSIVRRSLDSGGSVGVLLLAPVISAIAHGLALLLFGLHELVVSKGYYFFETSISFDPYPTYAALLGGSVDLNASGSKLAIGWALVFVALLCAAAVRVNWIFEHESLFKRSERPKRESRLAELLRDADRDDSLVLIGAVTTKTPPFEGMEGWIGPVDVVNLAANDEFLSIKLMHPSVFSINPEYPISEGEPTYDEFDSPFKTEVIHLDASEISRIEYFVIRPIDGSAEIELEPFTMFGEAEAKLSDDAAGDDNMD